MSASFVCSHIWIIELLYCLSSLHFPGYPSKMSYNSSFVGATVPMTALTANPTHQTNVSVRREVSHRSPTFGLTTAGYAACSACGVIYSINILIILISDCPFNNHVSYMFTFQLVALLSVVLTAAYRATVTRKSPYDIFAQTTILLYCGSAILILFGIIYTPFEGLCSPPGTPSGGLFQSKNAANYIVWVLTLIAFLIQTAAHYCFGW